MAQLPDPAAKARLFEIAALMDAGYNAAYEKFERLMHDLPQDLQAQVEAVQADYWNDTVGPYVKEIASLTNNSPTTITSVFRPTSSKYDLGGITPGSLRSVATDGKWKR